MWRLRPPGTARDYTGDFAGTPVFIGSSDVDPHVPLERVQESTEVFRRLGATVDERIYPRMGHTIEPTSCRRSTDCWRRCRDCQRERQ